MYFLSRFQSQDEFVIHIQSHGSSSQKSPKFQQTNNRQNQQSSTSLIGKKVTIDWPPQNVQILNRPPTIQLSNPQIIQIEQNPEFQILSQPIQLMNNQQYQIIQPSSSGHTIVVPIQVPQENNRFIVLQQMPAENYQNQLRQVTIKPEVINLDSESESEASSPEPEPAPEPQFQEVELAEPKEEDEEQFELIEIAPMAISEVKSLAGPTRKKPGPKPKKPDQPLSAAEKQFREFSKRHADMQNKKYKSSYKSFECPLSTFKTYPLKKIDDPREPLYRVNNKQQMFSIGRVTACYGKESDFKRSDAEDLEEPGTSGVPGSFEDPEATLDSFEGPPIKTRTSETEPDEEPDTYEEYIVSEVAASSESMKFFITEIEQDETLNIPQPTNLIQVAQNPTIRGRKRTHPHSPSFEEEINILPEVEKEVCRKVESRAAPNSNSNADVDVEQFLDTYLI